MGSNLSTEGAALVNQIAARPANDRAHTSGITYHMVRKGSRNYGNRLRFLSGRLMEDIPDSEIGKADLIASKRAAGRERDLRDLLALERADD